MSRRAELILKVALPVPLRRSFDYLIEEQQLTAQPLPGVRVRVPFGRTRNYTGIVLGVAHSSELPRERLKKVISIIDPQPLFDNTLLRLLEWASDYYQHPVGEVLFNALPAALRRGQPLTDKTRLVWQLTHAGRLMNSTDFQRAPAQARLLDMMQTWPSDDLQSELKQSPWRGPLQALLKKGVVQRTPVVTAPLPRTIITSHLTLNTEQQQAAASVIAHLDQAQRYLLYGVTGSGKTEVYMEVIRGVLAAGRQALILVPEIGLTPQIVQRLQQGIDCHLVMLHSALSDSERLRAWNDARDGSASIILGTRSAVWVPMKNPGVLIIDEEHDLSFKQQDGFRYSARDVAIMRSKLHKVPIILGTATPSMETTYNADTGKFISLTLSSRTGGAQHPVIGIVDIRAKQMHGALSPELVAAITGELHSQRQVLLFLNQRGFSPVIMCHACGWLAKCPRCDTRMIYHKRRHVYVCHRCDKQEQPATACPDCGSQELIQIGHGTERLAETLAELFPTARILRIDRDSTRRKDSMKKMLEQIQEGNADILIGTQMLAKGHHFPKLTLVGIIDSDRGLFSTDFRASERMAQLFIQVSGRAGREDLPGKVLIQTHCPQHPLIQAMINFDYREFARIIMHERREAGLPPYSYLALLRAEDYRGAAVERFLSEAKELLPVDSTGLEVFGPMPAILEKHAGRLRYQLLIQTTDRRLLQRTMEPWSKALENLPSAKRVRWSLDVDPQELV